MKFSDDPILQECFDTALAAARKKSTEQLAKFMVRYCWPGLMHAKIVEITKLAESRQFPILGRNCCLKSPFIYAAVTVLAERHKNTPEVPDVC